MDADHAPEGIERPTARDILDGIRDQLREPAADEMPLLLKISRELAELEDYQLAPADAAAWKARPETRRERLAAILGRQGAFKSGLAIGFLTGLALGGLFMGLLAMHWVVVTQ
jgi:predicted lipid-binding transport protein (Tim44 family)